MEQNNSSMSNLTNKLLQKSWNVSLKIKEGILILAGFGLAIILGRLLSALITDSLWGYLPVAIISGILFCAVYLYQVFFISGKRYLMAALFFECAALLVFFANFGWAAVSVFIVSYLLLLLGNFEGKSWMENAVRIKFWEKAPVLLSKAIVILFLVPSVFIPIELKRSEQEFPVSKDVFEAAVNSSRKVMSVFIPGIDFNMSVEEATRSILSDRIKMNEQIKNISSGAQEVIVEQGQKDLIGQFSVWLGIGVDPQKSIAQNLYDGLSAKFAAQPDRIKTVIFILLGALMFLSLSGLLWPIRFAVAVVSWIGYELLISFGFAKITYEERMKETITLG